MPDDKLFYHGNDDGRRLLGNVNYVRALTIQINVRFSPYFQL